MAAFTALAILAAGALVAKKIGSHQAAGDTTVAPPPQLPEAPDAQKQAATAAASAQEAARRAKQRAVGASAWRIRQRANDTILAPAPSQPRGMPRSLLDAPAGTPTNTTGGSSIFRERPGY